MNEVVQFSRATKLDDAVLTGRMFFATASETSSGNVMLAVVALFICAGAISLLAARWGKALKARADDEPRGQLTPGAWAVVAVVVAFFFTTVVLNLTGAW